MVLRAGECRAARRDPVLRRGQKIGVRDHGESVVLGVLCWGFQRGSVVDERLMIIAPVRVTSLTLRIGLCSFETYLLYRRLEVRSNKLKWHGHRMLLKWTRLDASARCRSLSEMAVASDESNDYQSNKDSRLPRHQSTEKSDIREYMIHLDAIIILP